MGFDAFFFFVFGSCWLSDICDFPLHSVERLTISMWHAIFHFSLIIKLKSFFVAQKILSWHVSLSLFGSTFMGSYHLWFTLGSVIILISSLCHSKSFHLYQIKKRKVPIRSRTTHPSNDPNDSLWTLKSEYDG